MHINLLRYQTDRAYQCQRSHTELRTKLDPSQNQAATADKRGNEACVPEKRVAQCMMRSISAGQGDVPRELPDQSLKISHFSDPARLCGTIASRFQSRKYVHAESLIDYAKSSFYWSRQCAKSQCLAFAGCSRSWLKFATYMECSETQINVTDKETTNEA